ncbi:MAG: polyribonucleotide nucleotidyltransferase [Anaerolineales bacterium]|nr:MAG: polyribonucleotide nucleotidyltransferase [Anaerolineales bacterium]
MNNEKSFNARLGNSTLAVETGKLAGQAGGAVTVRCGDTMILATATSAQTPREGTDFFPLTVDYEERLYAAGKIPGGFFKREGRPTEAAILLCRLTDRALRPLFPKGMRNDVQIVVTALSADQEHYLDILSIIGASAALSISDMPFSGPVGAIRVGYADGQLLLNPTCSEMQNSVLDLRLAGTADAIVMVEAGADEVSEDVILEALRQGHEAYQDVIRMQQEIRQAVGKPKSDYPVFQVTEEAARAVRDQLAGRIMPAIEQARNKEERYQALDELQAQVVGSLAERYPEPETSAAFDDYFKSEVRKAILDRGYRPDGRNSQTIRPIHCEVGLLPRTHGSGLFTRGETQVLTIATLGTVSDEQRIDGLGVEERKRYMHHYNFPPYSTGEARRMRGPGRREIGHGALAERALLPLIPSDEEFPYTLRLVSEVLSSNGSTSQASVCASSLALMDAGVPIQAPVAGIAMGLIKEGDRYAVLTDILGMEDHLGDMDFKVAGTAKGITALHMDLKTKGIGAEIMRSALEQAREARLFVLDKMSETIKEARPELSAYAPRITLVKIDPEKIGVVIGPGGKTIRHIIAETGANIDVEEDGTVYVASADKAASEKAVGMIEALTEEPEVGKIYTGRVVNTTDFGAFVEILPGRDGLVHISQLADYHVGKVEDVVKVGDEIMVMIIGIDSDGKIKLSRQAVIEGWTAEEARERDRGGRGGRRPPSRSRGPRGGRSRSREQR